MTNEELVDAAKKGCNKAYEELFERNINFCYAIAHRFSNIDEVEDLASVASYAMLKAYNSYETGKGVLFITYAGRCITNEILMHNRKAKKHRGNIHLEEILAESDEGRTVSFLDVMESTEGIPEDYCEEAIYGIMNACIQELDDRDKSIIVDIYYNDINQTEVAERLGVSQSYVSRLIKKILKQIRLKLLTHGVTNTL